ncbi:MAG TPA: class I SAM-dependent methyltransferase [Ardenticatenaceae bacterium]
MTDYLDLKTNFDDPRVASALDELSFWSSRFGALLLEHLELERGSNVLDIACGAGFPLFELAHAHGPSCRFVGVDLWQPALERAALKLGVYDLPNVSLARADAAHLPLPNTHFDLIVSNLGINNFEQPRAVLAECARVSKSGGRLVLTTNVKGHMQEFYDLFREVLTERWGGKYLDRLAFNEEHRGSRESVTVIVEEAGFAISRIVEDHFHLRFLDGSALFRHFLVRVGFLPGWREVVEPEDEQEVFATLEARLNEVAQREGGLKLTVPMLYVEARRRAAPE